MKKILFLIHDLGQGGAEKVLVNLVNSMDRSQFDISVTVLFGGGINERFLKPDIHFRAVYPREIPGNSKLMKIFTPAQLHKQCVTEQYDIEVSFLEGPSARVISGCQNANTKLVCWIHSTFTSLQDAAASFRSTAEAVKCYGRYDEIVCVSKSTQKAFQKIFTDNQYVTTLYNTIDSLHVLEQSRVSLSGSETLLFRSDEINLIAVGTLKPVKALDRLIRIHSRIQKEGYPVHTYLLGKGPDDKKLKQLVEKLGCSTTFTFLGYDTNPYKYVSASDLFVCSSLSEGYSTAATEALIIGTPVCTVEVSGAKEMLGEHDEYGIVTENSEEALYEGIKRLLDNPELLTYYRNQAVIRGKDFVTEKTVKNVENMLIHV